MWKLDCEESWAPKNWCFWTVVLEKTLVSPLDCKEIQPVHLKGDQFWVFIGGLILRLKLQYFDTSCEELTPWKRPWCWEVLGAGGEGDDRGWDGWIASPTQCTWVWVNSGSWCWTGRAGVLQLMGSERVGHNSYWIDLNWAMMVTNSGVLIWTGISAPNLLYQTTPHLQHVLDAQDIHYGFTSFPHSSTSPWPLWLFQHPPC